MKKLKNNIRNPRVLQMIFILWISFLIYYNDDGTIEA